MTGSVCHFWVLPNACQHDRKNQRSDQANWGGCNLANTRYRVLAGACLTQFSIIGLLFSYGVFFKPLQDTFDWSRTFLSSASALSFFMMGVLAILAGRLNDRFGPRIVLGVAGTVYGVGFLLLSQVSAPWQMYVIFGLFLGMGLGAHDVVTLSTIARWFPGRRGIMSGVVKSGTAIGQIVLPPFAAVLLLAYGWRQALFLLGIGAIVLLLLAALMMSRPPTPTGTAHDTLSEGQSFAQARVTPVFWTLCAIQFLFFPAMMTVPLHVAVHGSDLGMSATKAASLLSVLGAGSIAGRLIVGMISDRIGGKRAFEMCFVVLLSSLLAFTFFTTHMLLFVIVAAYGFSHGGLFTVVSPLVAEYYGMRAHGAIFGTILFFGTLGGAIGPIVAGWIFDVTASYQFAFAGLALLAAIGLGLVLSLPKPLKIRAQG
jgi:MFS family permease